MISKYVYALCLMLVFSSCAIKNVDYKRCENVRIDNLGLTPMLGMDLVYNNPNAVGCRISNTTVTIICGSDTLGLAVSNKEVKLKPYTDFTLPVETIVSLPVMLKISGQMLKSNEVSIDLKGSVTLKKFIFKRKINFSVREKLSSKDIL